MSGNISLKRKEMTPEQQKEVRLYGRWNSSKEKAILDEYTGKSIEEVPEEYREQIGELRKYRIGITVYEEVVEWLKAHYGKLMNGAITENGNVLKVSEMTKEQQKEVRLYDRWNRSKEKAILNEYAGKPIEEVPEEYRKKIAELRGLIKEKTPYEEVIEFLETHNGKLMRSIISGKGKNLKRKEMTPEQVEEIRLYGRWIKSIEREVLDEYAGKSIEEVPEEYREKIGKLRERIIKEKTTYEKVIEFLETHGGKLMNSKISENGKNLKRKEMTPEQHEEVKLYQRWFKSDERKILDEYAGKPIEEVPEEYREKIAKLRKFGLGMKKSRLSQAKQQRDEAKIKNNQAKELEEKVSEELKERGKNHEEQ